MVAVAAVPGHLSIDGDDVKRRPAKSLQDAKDGCAAGA